MADVLQAGEIELRVPALNQHKLHPGPDFNDNMACWFTAAQMVLAHRGATPPLELTNVATLGRLWKNAGIRPDHLDRLADEAGLEHTLPRALFRWMGAGEWHAALSALGPLIVVVGGDHAVVVRGIVKQGDGWFVVVNDPWMGATYREALGRFNGRMDRYLPVLYRRAAHRAPMMLQQPVQEPFRISY
ncbi:MAG: hypothetical protein EOO80_21175 [Oxalobacteraceae bacterium]|nr:MAG: hypothetical protein EOO80_21175 [Oxalobacteraceae bacterium]